jgi:hypothetical protein
MKVSRRKSVGYAYSSQQDASINANEPHGCNGQLSLYCSCKAGPIQKEIDLLQASSRSALRQAANEVEALNTKSVNQEIEIGFLKRQLKDSEKRSEKLKNEYKSNKKKLKEGELKRSNSSSTSLTAVSLLSADSSTHSLASMFSLKRPSSLKSSASMLSLARPSSARSGEGANSKSSSLKLNRNINLVTRRCKTESDLKNATFGLTKRNMIEADTKNATFPLRQSQGSGAHYHHSSSLQTGRPEIARANSFKLKIDMRDKEILVLEDVIRQNMKMMQELQQMLEQDASTVKCAT